MLMGGGNRGYMAYFCCFVVFVFFIFQREKTAKGKKKLQDTGKFTVGEAGGKGRGR